MGGLANGAPVAPYSPTSDELSLKNNTEVKVMKPSGLKNVGNTCYANAALQCILSTALAHALLDPTSTHVFRRYSSNPALLAVGSGEADTDSDNEINDEMSSLRREKKEARRKARLEQKKKIEKLLNHEKCQWLTGELTDITRVYTAEDHYYEKDIWSLDLFHLFSTKNDERIVDPGGITRHVDKISKTLRPYQQEDAHEFLRSLLSNLTLDGHNKQLSSLFDGLLESTVTCQTCYRVSITRDRYMDLSLDIQSTDTSTLYDALEDFTKTELIDKDNKVDCPRCKTKRRVSKGMRLATAPSVLVCQLKRFHFNRYGSTRVNKFIEYPLKLEIGDYMSRANKGIPRPYELVGALVHTGTRCDRGHYLAYVKSGNDWYRCSDENVTSVTIEEALKQQVYILFYEVEGMRKKNGYDNFSKYHRKNCEIKTECRVDDKIKYDSNEKRPSTPQEKITDLLESMLSLCGADSAAQAIRDGICDTEKKEEKKCDSGGGDVQSKKSCKATESDSATSSRSRNRDSIFRPPTPNKAAMRATSDHGARNYELSRITFHIPDPPKFSEESDVHIQSSPRLVRSSSSNCIVDMEDEAVGYDSQIYGLISREHSPSPTGRNEDFKEIDAASDVHDEVKRNCTSAPRSGRSGVECSISMSKSEDRLPPLPRNYGIIKKK